MAPIKLIRNKLGKTKLRAPFIWVRRAFYSPYCRPNRMVAARLGLCPTPDFLIIGAQRGGTTSIYRYLVEHPKVKGTLCKEVHFFDLNYAKGWNWYLAHFPARLRDDHDFIAGEASPYYLFHPHVPKRVAATLPHTKFIVVLRNPIERAHSHYQHEVGRGFEKSSFEEALAREDALMESENRRLQAMESGSSFAHVHYSYKSRGIYIEQLQRWLAHFPRERFLILKSEDLFGNPGPIFSQVLQFLKLPNWMPSSFSAFNEGKHKGQNGAARNALKEETRARLRAFYQPYNQQLSEFIGINVGDWI
jgi:hypothetical protein